MRIAFYIPVVKGELLTTPFPMLAQLLPALSQAAPRHEWVMAAFAPRPAAWSAQGPGWLNLSEERWQRLPGIRHTAMARRMAWQNAGIDLVIGFDGHQAGIKGIKECQWELETEAAILPTGWRKLPLQTGLWTHAEERAATWKKGGRQNVVVLPPAVWVPGRLPEFDEKQVVKNNHANGHEYFLCMGAGADVEAIVAMLKAFSLFKKRQLSRMKILIVMPPGKTFDALQSQLQSYKFRSDVLLQALPDMPDELLSSAYALLLPGMPGYLQHQWRLRAMAWGVPSIGLASAFGRQWIGGAGIHPDKTEPGVWAEGIKLLFKDEQWRSQLTEAGMQQASALSFDNLASAIAKAIEP